ncbi:hypothetical protein O6H91_23G024400 [Diphasiastrum complanatum]|uniref:Uncharacterized protein n=2 Tax=Diphasiastrum complanatum TaxID=34168 RepID=A0ACC2A906_DIPCM|nr:hypothetical protein O6H91_23G024400 [Diphasiastrum complanatum]KAJ7514054.1 hypothetical protein O6H91_23G024400 [Diphasiastrum complanatum]
MLLEIASDMDHATQNQEEIDEQARNFDRLVRLEVMRGCQLVQELQQKMKLSPPGCLSMHTCNDNGLIRASLIGAAAGIVTSFSNVITLLSSSPNEVHQAPMEGTDHNPSPSTRGGEMEPQQMANSPRLNSSSPMSSSKTLDSPISGTPPPSPPPIKQFERLLHPSPPFCSSETPPQSPKNRSPSVKRSNPSPQPRSSDSIRAAKLHKFEPTTGLPAPLDLNENIVKTGTQAGSKVKSENVESEPGEQISISKRRKYMPKWTVKLPGSNTEQGSEAAPEDGYTWRKYGQKVILGSRHPRSYYRCTYKRELNCPAIKYVQKSDDDSPVFHVTYKGEHTCQSTKLYRPRSYSYSVFPMGSLPESQSSLQGNSSCLTLSSSGSLQVGQCGPTLSATKDFQLVGSFVSSPLRTNSTDNALSKSLIFKPTPSFPLPELARTPKFGIDGDFSNMHFQPRDSIGATNSIPCNVRMLIDGFDPPKMTISQAQNENIKLSHGDIKICQPDEMHKLARSNSSSLNRETSKDFKQSVKQLINHLCLDDTEGYESSADQDMSECPAERFSPTTSEVVSNCLPLESLQRSFHDSKSKSCVTATPVEDRPPNLDSDITEVVAEHVPSCKFELDFILDSPGSQQQMLDLQTLLFDT